MHIPLYTITPSILSTISKIAEIKAVVGKTPLLPQRELFLRRWAHIRITHTSTRIEGNTLDEFQVQQVSEGKPVRADKKHITEVQNYLAGLRLIDRLNEKKKQIETKDIFLVHRTVMRGLIESVKSGALRFKPAYIVNVNQKGVETLVYTPPPARKVPILIGEVLLWLQTSDEHPIIRAGLFHYLFETIHPFADGNGRTGRLLTLLHLYQSEWDFRRLLVLEDYYNEDREKYFVALQTGKTYDSRRNADLTFWLTYYVKGFLHEAQKVQQQILGMQGVGKSPVVPRHLTNDELRMVDFALSLGKMTSQDVVDMLMIPKRTAQSRLRKLVEMKILQPHGAARATYYTVAMP